MTDTHGWVTEHDPPSTASPELRIEPCTSRVDQPLSIAVVGLVPGASVRLRVSVVDGNRQEWASWATFRADATGRVDVAAQAPVEGTYAGVDAAGPLWSLVPVDTDRWMFFQRRRPTALHYTAAVDQDGEILAEGSFERYFRDPEVSDTPLDPAVGVGTLWVGPASGPRPGVLLLGGSDGGQFDHAAALLAAHGHAVLALSYFGAEDAPPRLEGIELDDLGRAVDWLVDRPETDGDRVAVVGLSRGGELALQLGSLFPRVGAVVAGAPSSFRQAGLAESPTDFTRPAWLRAGEPLPFVAGSFSPRTMLDFLVGWLRRRPIRMRPGFERLWRRVDQVRRATIEVERIRGPVLLLSGSDDQLWPSEAYASAVEQRLRDHPYDVRHVRHHGAGHFVSAPYALPGLPPLTRTSPTGWMTIDFGGSIEANARAATASWTHLLDFLDRFRSGPTAHQGSTTR